MVPRSKRCVFLGILDFLGLVKGFLFRVCVFFLVSFFRSFDRKVRLFLFMVFIGENYGGFGVEAVYRVLG